MAFYKSIHTGQEIDDSVTNSSNNKQAIEEIKTDITSLKNVDNALNGRVKTLETSNIVVKRDINDLQTDVNHISGVDIPNLESDKENVATSIIENAPETITDINSFYTAFYNYRKSAQRKYLISGGTEQTPTNESIINALGGYPKGFQHKTHWALYVELPIDYSGGFTVRVKLIGSIGNDFYERSIKGWNGSNIKATEWNNYYKEKQDALPQQDLDNIAMINQYAQNIQTNTSDINSLKTYKQTRLARHKILLSTRSVPTGELYLNIISGYARTFNNIEEIKRFSESFLSINVNVEKTNIPFIETVSAQIIIEYNVDEGQEYYYLKFITTNSNGSDLKTILIPFDSLTFLKDEVKPY